MSPIVSFVGTGASFTSVTVTTNVSVAVWPLVAVTVTVIVDVPSDGLLASGAGVISSVRDVPDPFTTTLAFGINVVLLEVAVTEVINAPVPSPMLKVICGTAVSSAVVLSVMLSTVGCASYAPMSTVWIASGALESATRGKKMVTETLPR